MSQKHTDAVLKFTYHVSFSLSNTSPVATAVLVHTWHSGPIQRGSHSMASYCNILSKKHSLKIHLNVFMQKPLISTKCW